MVTERCGLVSWGHGGSHLITPEADWPPASARSRMIRGSRVLLRWARTRLAHRQCVAPTAYPLSRCITCNWAPKGGDNLYAKGYQAIAPRPHRKEALRRATFPLRDEVHTRIHTHMPTHIPVPVPIHVIWSIPTPCRSMGLRSQRWRRSARCGSIAFAMLGSRFVHAASRKTWGSWDHTSRAHETVCPLVYNFKG